MGTRTVLELVQEFCGLRGLPVPSALMGATTAAVVQYRALLNETLREAVAYPWPAVKVQSTFTSVATANQGELETLFPGFNGFVKDSLWMSPQVIPIRGPLTDSSWAALTALGISGPPYSFWLSGGSLYFTPTPAAGNTVTAIYTTDYRYFNGTTPKRELTEDSDTCIVPDRILLAGLQAFWAKAKGLTGWEKDLTRFESAVSQELAPSLPTFNLGDSNMKTGPRIFIPPGSWLT